MFFSVVIKTLSLSIWVAIVAVTFSSVSAAPPTFVRKVIDSTFYGDCIAIGDINGDGWQDVVVGGKKMVWYSYSNWAKHVIAEPKAEFLGDVQVADIDGDGDNDIVTSDGGGRGNILWLENPRIGGGSIWTRHTIGSQGEFKWDWVTDLQVADLDTNGTFEVVTRGAGKTHVWIDTAVNSKNEPWLDRDLTFSTMKDMQGLQLCDLTGDKRPDLILNGYYLQTPSFEIIDGEFNQNFVMSGWPTRTTPAAGDINGDGRNEVAFVAADNTSRIAVYSTGSNPPGVQWTEHPGYANTGYVRSMKFADIDGDGKKDIVFAEMKGYVKSRLAYLKAGNTFADWVLHVIDSCGSYNIQVADFGKNGDIDIVGCNTDEGPIYLWENQRNGPNADVKKIGVGGRALFLLRIIEQWGSIAVEAPGAFECIVTDTRGNVMRRWNGAHRGVYHLRDMGCAPGTYMASVRCGAMVEGVKVVIGE